MDRSERVFAIAMAVLFVTMLIAESVVLAVTLTMFLTVSAALVWVAGKIAERD